MPDERDEKGRPGPGQTGDNDGNSIGGAFGSFFGGVGDLIYGDVREGSLPALLGADVTSEDPAIRFFGGGSNTNSLTDAQQAAISMAQRLRSEYPDMDGATYSAVIQLAERRFNLGDDPNLVLTTMATFLEERGLRSVTADLQDAVRGTTPAESGNSGTSFFDIIRDPSGFTDAAMQAQAGQLQQLVADAGLYFRGFTSDGNVIAIDPVTEKPSIYTVGPGGSLQWVTSDPKAFPGGGGGGGGGGAGAAHFQNIGVDKDGYAIIFNPATGAITRGALVGHAQLDPAVVAAEEARRFNEQQSLREGEYLREVLSNGRNFLTAAYLSRGQAGGSPLANTTQADLLRRGGVGAAPQTGLPGFGPTAGGAPTPPKFVTDALPGFTGVRPGEVDPRTLAPFAGSNFGATSSFAQGDKPALQTSSQTAYTGNPNDLAAMAAAFAPPAVKDVLAGKEVGALGTATGTGAVPLASVQTLRNLTADEAGALDTTLQVTDQRNLADYTKEAEQRFLGQGSRTATRG